MTGSSHLPEILKDSSSSYFVENGNCFDAFLAVIKGFSEELRPGHGLWACFAFDFQLI